MCKWLLWYHPLLLDPYHALFLRMLLTFFSHFTTQLRRTGPWRIFSSFEIVAPPLVLWEEDRHLYRSLTERLLASWPPAPFLLWLLSPQSRQVLSQHCPQPADPSIWIHSSGRRGRMEQRRDERMERKRKSCAPLRHSILSQTLTLHHSENKIWS